MNKEAIERVAEDFKQQLILTCKIHRCDPAQLDDRLWNITLDAARTMQTIERPQDKWEKANSETPANEQLVRQ